MQQRARFTPVTNFLLRTRTQKTPHLPTHIRAAARPNDRRWQREQVGSDTYPLPRDLRVRAPPAPISAISTGAPRTQRLRTARATRETSRIARSATPAICTRNKTLWKWCASSPFLWGLEDGVVVATIICGGRVVGISDDSGMQWHVPSRVGFRSLSIAVAHHVVFKLRGESWCSFDVQL